MARYFFHMATKGKQVDDAKGKELHDLTAAHEHALHLIYRAMSCLCERDTAGWMVKIGASDGTVPLTVIFPQRHFGRRIANDNGEVWSNAPPNPKAR